MPSYQYQPLRDLNAEGEETESASEKETFRPEFSRRPRGRRTKKWLIHCALSFALLLLVAAIAGGVATIVVYLVRQLSADGSINPSLSPTVSSPASQHSPSPPSSSFSDHTASTALSLSLPPTSTFPSSQVVTATSKPPPPTYVLSTGPSPSMAQSSEPQFSCTSPSFSTLSDLSPSLSAYVSYTASLSYSVSSSSLSPSPPSPSLSPSPPTVSTSMPMSLSPSPSPTPKPTERCSNDDEVCKGTNNAFQYRVISLPNALRVLLISNNETSTAAAAMDVRSGSFQDTIPGLAHFCEHMLFLGTEKYPDEGEYAQFLTSNGGYDNAYTASENTNYFFTVNSEKLEEALDRFSQFFISPLFNEGAVDRERMAVNSEYEKDKGVPGWHFYLLMKHVADPRSAFSRFNIGSTETLNVPDLRQQVMAYYNRRYSSSLMQLVIYGKQDLDQLQSWATNKFSSILNRGTLPPYPPYPAYPAGYSPRLIVYKPLTPTPQLSIVWQTPSRQDLYRYGVESFISVLFSYGGQGSLSHYLKISNPWATSVSFDVQESTSGFALFSVDIDLTEAGAANIDDVVAGVFGYIAMLRDSSDEELHAVWEGRNKLDKIKFDYASPPSDISSYVSGLAATMRTVKHPADFLSPPQRSIWDVIQVRSLLDYLTPHSSNIFFAKPSLVYDNETAHPSIHGDCTHPSAAHHNLNVSSADLIEPYFGTQYAIYCTDSKLIQKWEKPNVPVGTFFLPDFETYTPHNLTLLPLPADHSKVPQLVHDDKQGYRVWWMQDYQFRAPVVIVKCQAYTGAVAATARDQALSLLYVNYVTELLTEVTDKASAASYQAKLELLPSGIAVQFSGYSDPDVIMRFMEDVLQGASAVSEESFMVHRDTLALAYQETVDVQRNYQSSTLPYSYVVELARLMLLDPRFLYSELLDVLGNFTVDDLPAALAQHMGTVLKSISRLECYTTGNVDRDGAMMYSGKVMEKLMQNSTAGERQEGKVKVVKLKQGTTALATGTLNPAVDDNSAIMVVKEVGPMCDVTADPKNGSAVTCSEESLENTVYANVLSLIMKDACFNTLRTQEQLGYVVACGAFSLDSTLLALFFLVQSAKPPPYLLDRIDNFTDTFFSDKVLDATFFEQGLQAYKVLLQADDKNLQEQVDRLWIAIHNQHYSFDQREKLLITTERVSHVQFVNFYSKYVTGNLVLHTPSVRELVVGAFSGGIANVTFDVPRQVEAQDQYDSVRQFKKSAKYWDQ